MRQISYQVATTVARSERVNIAAYGKTLVMRDEMLPKLNEMKALTAEEVDEISASGLFRAWFVLGNHHQSCGLCNHSE